jgi:hypothetical protein
MGFDLWMVNSIQKDEWIVILVLMVIFKPIFVVSGSIGKALR